MKLNSNTRNLILFLNISFIIQSIPDNQPTVIIHNHITGSSAQATAQNQVTTEQETHSSVQTITSFYDDMKKAAPYYYNQLLQNKYKIAATFICASFIHAQYKLHRIHTLLQDPTSWCNWKSTTSMQQLVCTPHDELIPALLADIQKKYLLSLKIKTPHSKMSPFDQFIKDISNELTLLQWCITIQKYSKTLYISKIFYFTHKKSFIQEKINRLHIMLDIFISWQTKELLK